MENNIKNIKICLIGGTGRSGTSILLKIFSMHPDLTDLPELRFLIDPDGLLDFYGTMHEIWSPYLFDVKIRRLESLLKDIGKARLKKIYYLIDRIIHIVRIEQVFPYHLLPRYSTIGAAKYCPNYFKFVDRVIKELSEFHYNGEWIGNNFLQKKMLYYAPCRNKEELSKILGKFYRNIVLDVIENQRVKFFLEKNTWNILWFDKILEILPEARLVHIYRDPRDIVASYTKQSWSPSDPAQAAKWYKGIINRWFEIRRDLPPESFMEISLEQLVQNTCETLKAVCSFWKIDWSDNLLQVKLNKAHTGRWRKDFSQAEQVQIELVLKDEIHVLGYGK